MYEGCVGTGHALNNQSFLVCIPYIDPEWLGFEEQLLSCPPDRKSNQDLRLNGFAVVDAIANCICCVGAYCNPIWLTTGVYLKHNVHVA